MLMLIQDIDSVTVRTVSQALEEIDSGANALHEAYKKEFQRRGAAEQEYSTMLPPEVVAVLTDCDSRESEMEDAHISAHVKFADTVRKFFTKLQQEEKNFKEKIDQVQGNRNVVSLPKEKLKILSYQKHVQVTICVILKRQDTSER